MRGITSLIAMDSCQHWITFTVGPPSIPVEHCQWTNTWIHTCRQTINSLRTFLHRTLHFTGHHRNKLQSRKTLKNLDHTNLNWRRKKIPITSLPMKFCTKLTWKETEGRQPRTTAQDSVNKFCPKGIFFMLFGTIFTAWFCYNSVVLQNVTVFLLEMLTCFWNNCRRENLNKTPWNGWPLWWCCSGNEVSWQNKFCSKRQIAPPPKKTEQLNAKGLRLQNSCLFAFGGLERKVVLGFSF